MAYLLDSRWVLHKSASLALYIAFWESPDSHFQVTPKVPKMAKVAPSFFTAFLFLLSRTHATVRPLSPPHALACREQEPSERHGAGRSGML